MTTNELQNVVTTEAVCLFLIILIMISSLKRWKLVLYASSAAASLAFFAAWSTIMAFASIMIYGPASILMWIELDKQGTARHEKSRKIVRTTCWGFLVTGVSLLIAKNIYNIYGYLT